MALTVVDTSVLVGFLDGDDALHDAATAALRAAPGPLVVPAVAYAELVVGAARRGEASVQAVDAFVDATARVEPLARAAARRAARLRALHGLRLPDALVLATGLELDATTILTGDRTWRRVDARVRLVEP